MYQIINGGKSVGSCKERPTLHIEEIQDEGGFHPGESHWHPLNANLTEAWEGKTDLFLRLYREKELIETWSLIGCRTHQNQIFFDSVYYVPNI